MTGIGFAFATILILVGMGIIMLLSTSMTERLLYAVLFAAVVWTGISNSLIN